MTLCGVVNVIIVLILQIKFARNGGGVYGFNVSPVPNLDISEPILAWHEAKNHSSYFGFSLNLRDEYIFIGAPRSPSFANKQKTVTMPGAMYSCSLWDAHCNFVTVDNTGNLNRPTATFNEIKDEQWMGMSMAGGPQSSDPFVVCAPKIKIPKTFEITYMMGICYSAKWRTNKTATFERVKPLWDPAKIRQTVIVPNKPTIYRFYYMLGEMGFSSHYIPENRNFIYGAPGVVYWRGSVVISPTASTAQKDYLIVDMNSADRANLTRYHAYFGYAVSSINFNTKDTKDMADVWYVASAPRIMAIGKVFIFRTIADTNIVTVGNEFLGTQFWEYFGYALLADDFNGDGRTDLAISAPFHSFGSDHFDNGIVYVYLNQGDVKRFSKAIELSGSKTVDGRFGMTMAKIGDIDRNGYADLAIGAPFEGDGVVYIFSGGPNGVAAKATQVLRAPGGWPTVLEPGRAMFGLSISAGVDIDANGFNDIAIGAPNVDRVFVYRTYPVVSVHAVIKPLKQEVGFTEDHFTIQVCWSLEAYNDMAVEIFLLLEVNKNRLLLERNNRTDFVATQMAVAQEQCSQFVVLIVKKDNENAQNVTELLEMKVTHQLLPMPDLSQVFNESVAFLNPDSPRTSLSHIKITDGCKNTVCNANLKMISSFDEKYTSFIVGLSDSITIVYDIGNGGEIAFLPKFECEIVGSPLAVFAKIPKNCQISLQNKLICDLNGRVPFPSGGITQLIVTITIPPEEFTANELIVKAIVSSSSDDINDSDNFVRDTIAMSYLSNLEIFGIANPKMMLAQEDEAKILNGTHYYEIRNKGPSRIGQLDVTIKIPIAYDCLLDSSRILTFIDYADLFVDIVHDNQRIDAAWTEASFAFLRQFGFQNRQLPKSHLAMTDNYLTIDNGIEDAFGEHFFDPSETSMANNRRRRRDVVPQDELDRRMTLQMLNGSSMFNGTLDDRTIVLDCDNGADIKLYCVETRITVINVAVRKPLSIRVLYRLDTSNLQFIFPVEQKIIWQISVTPACSSAVNCTTSNIYSKKAYTSIEYKPPYKTPLWIILLSSLLGFIIFLVIFHGLKKCGFFKRAVKEQLIEQRKELANMRMSLMEYYDGKELNYEFKVPD